MLAKSYRLNRNDEIFRVLKEGKFVRGALVNLKFLHRVERSGVEMPEQVPSPGFSTSSNQKRMEESIRAGDSATQKIPRETPTVVANPFGNSRGNEVAARIGNDSHFAVVVSKKVFARAVDRNRAKRLVREATRLLLPGIKDGYEAVLLIQSGIEGKKMQEVKGEVERLFRKVGLLKNL